MFRPPLCPSNEGNRLCKHDLYVRARPGMAVQQEAAVAGTHTGPPADPLTR